MIPGEQQQQEQPSSNITQVRARPIVIDKNWHKSITLDFRNNMIYKIVNTIFPVPDPSTMLDQRLRNLVSFAVALEGDMCELAKSKEQYFHLITNKIVKLKWKLIEKKQKQREMIIQ